MVLFYLIVLELNTFLRRLKKFIGNKNMQTNIFKIQANNSIMCGYFFIGFIGFKLAGKTLADYTRLFLSDDFEKKMTA